MIIAMTFPIAVTKEAVKEKDRLTETHLIDKHLPTHEDDTNGPSPNPYVFCIISARVVRMRYEMPYVKAV